MTQLKKQAIDLIERIPEKNMRHVFNILKAMEPLTAENAPPQNNAMDAFDELKKFWDCLPSDFDSGKELELSLEEKYGRVD